MDLFIQCSFSTKNHLTFLLCGLRDRINAILGNLLLHNLLHPHYLNVIKEGRKENN